MSKGLTINLVLPALTMLAFFGCSSTKHAVSTTENYLCPITSGIGFLNKALGELGAGSTEATIDWKGEETSFGFSFGGGLLYDAWKGWNSLLSSFGVQNFGAITINQIFFANENDLPEEHRHVWQQRFFGHGKSFYYTQLWNSAAGFARTGDFYEGNFFERQAKVDPKEWWR